MGKVFVILLGFICLVVGVVPASLVAFLAWAHFCREAVSGWSRLPALSGVRRLWRQGEICPCYILPAEGVFMKKEKRGGRALVEQGGRINVKKNIGSLLTAALVTATAFTFAPGGAAAADVMTVVPGGGATLVGGAR
ncbi:MAG: hypothetical protein AB1776_08660 [Bacillota bacterium]